MKTSANMMETVEQAMQPAHEVVDKDITLARKKLEHTLGAAKASLHDGTKRIQATVRHAAEGTDEFVHSNPWPAIGIAAAAGAAIAVLLSARTVPLVRLVRQLGLGPR